MGKLRAGARAVVFGMLAAAALPLAGCGSEPIETGVADTVRRALAAFSASDEAALCELLSSRGRLVVGRSAHGSPPFECTRDVRMFTAGIRPYPGDAEPRLTAISDGGGRAVAHLRLPGGSRSALRLSEEGGQWRLDGLFDAALSHAQFNFGPRPGVAFADPQPMPLDARSRVAVSVLRASAGPSICPSLDASALPEMRGGCVVEAAATSAVLSVWTPFGILGFGDCELTLTMRVDGRGRAWVADFDPNGPSPCNDAYPCPDEDGNWVPWQASIVRAPGSGGVVLRIHDACLESCIGRFEGRWDAAVLSRRDGMRLRFVSSLGSGGWTVNGVLRSRTSLAVDVTG